MYSQVYFIDLMYESFVTVTLVLCWSGCQPAKGSILAVISLADRIRAGIRGSLRPLQDPDYRNYKISS